MSEIVNRKGNDAIEKIRDLISHAEVGMLCTRLSEVPFAACPMYTQHVDDSGQLWFFSHAGNVHLENIQQDERVQLIYTNPGTADYLVLFGKATIFQEEATIEKVWSAPHKVWNSQDKNDESLRVIRVEPLRGHYWDSNTSQALGFLKMAASFVTGKKINNIESGDLEV